MTARLAAADLIGDGGPQAFDLPTERLDVLLYCHDGRGLGHVSRSVAIALALRRLFPAVKVSLLTGSGSVPTLAGKTLLDWIKLPAYRNSFKNGEASSLPSGLGFSLEQLVKLRAILIADVIAALRPRLVLVDHYPDGKNGELLRALYDPRCSETVWMLGLRAIVGSGSRVWSDEARQLVMSRYRRVLWYGDPVIAGRTEFARVSARFSDASPAAAGYVSRAVELAKSEGIASMDSLDGIAAFTWCSEKTLDVIAALADVIAPSRQRWRMVIGPVIAGTEDHVPPAESSGASVPSFGFLGALRSSRVAVVYAGYNTLTDVAWARVPALVIIRDTADREQEIHARHLRAAFGRQATFIRERAAGSAAALTLGLEQVTEYAQQTAPLPLVGAETAACILASCLA